MHLLDVRGMPRQVAREIVTVAGVSLRGRLRVLRVVVGGGPGGRVRRRLRRGRRAPALVVAGARARARRAVPRVRRLPGRRAPALVPAAASNVTHRPGHIIPVIFKLL